MRKIMTIGIICAFLVVSFGITTSYAFWFPPSTVTYIEVTGNGNYEIQVCYNGISYSKFYIDINDLNCKAMLATALTAMTNGNHLHIEHDAAKKILNLYLKP